MNNELSKADGTELVRALDRAEVLALTVAQLRKDLGLDPRELPEPVLGDGAFETLRGSVEDALVGWQRTGSAGFSRAINRVDLTERMVTNAMAHGGLHELAGTMVRRCLLKVLLRKRFAGEG